jgi:TM2 domain-containing membrane protein YozV
VAFSLKDPAWRAALFSGLIWPGAGQFLNHQVGKGVAFILFSLVVLSALLVRITRLVWERVLEDPAWLDPSRAFTLAHELEREHTSDLAPALLALGVLWLLSIWDAWRCAPRPDMADARQA